ncbi:S-methyl-5-thioribose-1-phosphate isomerase [Botrimarina hoheduenensis]|uniref:Methylthioribose-1-phosphate isomerase n=1 Tax=Botrimarina hoheduenensis TaxID=2528000 RepID=A0A5C5WCJ1_9BACT|nr:S-methyl-5-thioribose-1-phosphate isomerase [Botrimarina hoheduenensis]TWT48384.1 Methylthioribose-1-phosphate isomerase [Botrimarina hoheduenensis]
MTDSPAPPANPLSWTGGADGFLTLLDQTLLPGETRYINCETVEEVWQAIKRLAVRGAPAIGIAAAYGVVLATRDQASRTACDAAIEAACDHLATSRPTAVNLFWALERMRRVAHEFDPEQLPILLAKRLLAEAQAIHQADRAQCAAIGRFGAELLAPLGKGAGILTHCNTGALATGGDGTALAAIFTLHAQGLAPRVFADETRPLLQGARLTAWELMQRGLDATLITDSMPAPLMRDGVVKAVIVGADRIAANGDAANKIGTYGLAVLARHHGVPFYIAAPSTTFDLSIASGAAIPIEQRAAEEVTEPMGVRFAPAGIKVDNPAFDVTPAELITALVTERGVIEPVSEESIGALLTEVVAA